MRVLICPDKFKGSLSAREAGAAIERGVRRALPRAETVVQPLADGGEGSLELLAARKDYRELRLPVPGPLRRPVQASYLMGAEHALIESAAACGLHLVPPTRRHPKNTTTIGVGALIEDAVARGAGSITLLLGGSATSDGGAGMAAALGYRFLSERGEDFVPMADSLQWVARIETGNRLATLAEVDITAVYDVAAPLLGPTGATYTYAIQKGAAETELPALENNMRHFAQLLMEMGMDVGSQPGAGAAGGLGAGAIAFLSARMRQGTEFIFEQLDFTELIDAAELVITGEGKIDRQTLQGKVISGVLAYGKPTIAVCGESELTTEQLGATSILSIMSQPTLTRSAAIVEAATYLERMVYEYLRSDSILTP